MTGWDGIDEFVAVAAAGSFAGAASALGVSTSHVSRAVRRLEGRIQAQLFFRTTRRVTLTDTGRILVEQCQRMVEDRDEALAIVSESGTPQGKLRLTCSTALGERFVAPIIRQFAQENQQLSVELELTNRVVDLVGEGMDLAIRTGNLSDSILVSTRIASRRFLVCAAPEYLDRAGRPKKLSDLSEHQCLVGTATLWQFQVDGTNVTFRPKGNWRCNSGAVTIDAALSAMGICQIPAFYAQEFIQAGKLETVLDEFCTKSEPVWAVSPHRRYILPKVRILVERLRQELTPALRT